MLTYQIRRHRLIFDWEPKWYRFIFFGMAAEGGRALIRPSPDSPDVSSNSAIFNANTGEHYVRSKTPLSPLDVTILEDERRTIFVGCKMTLRQRFADLASFGDSINSIHFAMLVLSSVEFADPPHVERVDGHIGSSYLRWEFAGWQIKL